MQAGNITQPFNIYWPRISDTSIVDIWSCNERVENEVACGLLGSEDIANYYVAEMMSN